MSSTTSPVERLPVPIQTLYAELVDRAWTGNLAELMASGGSAYAREVNGRRYWYWQPRGSGGARETARYLGPDSDLTRARIEAQTDLATIRKDRVDTVRALRAARMPVPDRMTGDILAALSAAGAFRLRAVLVGSVAFQAYLPLLGFRAAASLAVTGDVDIAQFRSVAIGVKDAIDADFLDALGTVHPRFEAVPSATGPGATQRYALRAGQQETFSVDLLCPPRGALRDSITTLRSLRGNAVILRHLDFLLYREVNAAILHGPGIPVNVPAPERYALHKLLVSEMRVATPGSQAKARKDHLQADILIRVLAADRPDDLSDAWTELRARGPSWRLKADRAVARLPADTRALMQAIAG